MASVRFRQAGRHPDNSPCDVLYIPSVDIGGIIRGGTVITEIMSESISVEPIVQLYPFHGHTVLS